MGKRGGTSRGLRGLGFWVPLPKGVRGRKLRAELAGSGEGLLAPFPPCNLQPPGTRPLSN